MEVWLLQNSADFTSVGGDWNPELQPGAGAAANSRSRAVWRGHMPFSNLLANGSRRSLGVTACVMGTAVKPPTLLWEGRRLKSAPRRWMFFFGGLPWSSRARPLPRRLGGWHCGGELRQGPTEFLASIFGLSGSIAPPPPLGCGVDQLEWGYRPYRAADRLADQSPGPYPQECQRGTASAAVTRYGCRRVSNIALAVMPLRLLVGR